LTFSGCSSAKSRVVLYCAQDREFAETILSDFTGATGLAVLPRYDTEANKSVSLYEDLVHEARRPRCDVHWNNEILGTIRLQKQGLLEPYASPAAGAYPKRWRAADHSWHAFAARARVLVVNTELVPRKDLPRSLLDLTHNRWRGRVALAKPQFGTSATQAACLFQVLGRDGAREYYLGLKKNGARIVAGNKQVAEGVGQGRFAVGVTDTDDAIAEVEAGRPVAIIFPDQEGGKDNPALGTLFIPNAIAVIRGCPNPEGARKLVDYLLSPEVEKKLAESASHQILLNTEVKARLPQQIKTPQTVKPMEVDFARAADSWEEVQTFLTEEFARP
jgi:iron(III) transport system substrate-binding protein